MTGRTVVVPPEVAVLAPFVEAGVFDSSEVQLAAALVRLAPDLTDPVVLAAALAARGPRLGHVCVRLDDTASVVGQNDTDVVELPWPERATWAAALSASAAVAGPSTYSDEPFRPLVWDGTRLYLQRFWDYEVAVADALTRRARQSSAEAGPGRDDLDETLEEVFGPAGPGEPDRQRSAVRVALSSQVSVIAGGPGTGKTRTIARLLTVAQQVAGRQQRALEIALAAPTGKAATRMTEAVQREAVSGSEPAAPPLLEATTLHRLLGSSGNGRFRHDESNPLPHDLVIVDEASMVPLQLMARLLRALRPAARLVLVGDPDQLASVEAGSVLDDVVGPVGRDSAASAPDGPLNGRVTALHRIHRFAAGSPIAALANAVRMGDAAGAIGLLSAGQPGLDWVRPDDQGALSALRELVAATGVEVVEAARAGEPARAIDALNRIKVLCATRYGSFGLFDWSDRIEADVAAQIPLLGPLTRWYVGRPVIVTANDYVNKVANGDVGVVVQHGGGPVVAIQAGADLRLLPPSRLDRVDSWWAMTIHKSQGSEFPHAVVSLPVTSSRHLSRQLLYTAVTRAQVQVTVVATESALRAAVDQPVARASGLRERLWGDG
ncbi:MAG TPA: exodeoxyribonuclease V subunit alpha [Acidimicrobiales bacterium]|jgi:exodeoxyribonuclease V alpha subunit|nr:exodeoxyribonuclease V subunit alpha [Acidimicrobiales bacterium]